MYNNDIKVFIIRMKYDDSQDIVLLESLNSEVVNTPIFQLKRNALTDKSKNAKLGSVDDFSQSFSPFILNAFILIINQLIILFNIF